MSRWQPDAAGRLQQAALALFGERGFENTTIVEITERAGLTKRTFFRYFADKREVLFRGSEELEALFVSAVDAAPTSASALDAAAAALYASAPMFEQRRPLAAQRQQIIAANPELQERELMKLDSLTVAVTQALRRRGVGDPAAVLAARAAITVFKVAFERWADPGNRQQLEQIIRESLVQLRLVTAA